MPHKNQGEAVSSRFTFITVECSTSSSQSRSESSEERPRSVPEETSWPEETRRPSASRGPPRPHLHVAQERNDAKVQETKLHRSPKESRSASSQSSSSASSAPSTRRAYARMSKDRRVVETLNLELAGENGTSSSTSSSMRSGEPKMLKPLKSLKDLQDEAVANARKTGDAASSSGDGPAHKVPGVPAYVPVPLALHEGTEYVPPARWCWTTQSEEDEAGTASQKKELAEPSPSDFNLENLRPRLLQQIRDRYGDVIDMSILMAHQERRCIPCAKYTLGNCTEGTACKLCHLGHSVPKQKRLKKSKRDQLKKMVENTQLGDLASAQACMQQESACSRSYLTKVLVGRQRKEQAQSSAASSSKVSL